MSSRIDVHIEHKNAPEPAKDGHPNTCPGCGSHYRDDELDEHLWVCPQCGHHFPMRARARIAHLADEGSFVESAAELRSEDPLQFFDLRPYTERLAEAGRDLGLREPLGVGPHVEELERILGAQLGRRLEEAALVGEVRDPGARPHREVVAALGADPEVLVELVVAVVRAAARARVGVAPVSQLGRVLVLDVDVDPAVHGEARV